MELKVLLVEDVETDAEWVERALLTVKNPTYQLKCVQTLEAGRKILCEKKFDIIISDLKLADGEGLEISDALHEASPQTPMILLTGNVTDQEIAVEAMKRGVQDYFIKGNITPEILNRSILYAMERHRLMQLKDEFVNIVSHEFRGPLTILGESVAQVRDGLHGPISAEQKEYLEICLSTVKRLKATSDELLDLSKMEVGKENLDITEFDLIKMVREMEREFKSLAEQKGLTLNILLPVESLTLKADKGKISRVFLNLFMNALKFTDKGSIEIALKQQEAGVECSVKDSGVGISEEDIPKLFNKFEQFGKKSGSHSQGTGLGLSICKEIIAAHKGKIWVTSKQGEGATFFFFIPRQN